MQMIYSIRGAFSQVRGIGTYSAIEVSRKVVIKISDVFSEFSYGVLVKKAR